MPDLQTKIKELRRTHKRDLLAAADAPKWVVDGDYKTLWERIEDSKKEPPWSVSDVSRCKLSFFHWSVKVTDRGHVVVQMTWEKYTQSGHLSESALEDMGFNGLGMQAGPQYEYAGEGSLEKPIEHFYRTWAEARGGWPLPGDPVKVKTPDGLLKTTVQAIQEGMVILPSGRGVTPHELVLPEPMRRYEK